MRDLREDHDYTQTEVADYLKTSQTMYARYERGANELPIRHLVSLCLLYHVSADYLLGLSNMDPAYDQRQRTEIFSQQEMMLLREYEKFLLWRHREDSGGRQKKGG